MFGERIDEDSTKVKAGRPFRDYCYLMSTNQNFDRANKLDIFRDVHGVVASSLFVLFLFLGVPAVILSMFLLYAVVRFGLRWWAVAPSFREDGARHVLVVFESAGFWHVAEYVRGKGEIIRVLVDDNGAIPATTGSHVFDKVMSAKWGDVSTDDAPRQIIRRVKTYRRRPSCRFPYAIYPRTSVGYVAHVLGINNSYVRTPKDLLDFCERAGEQEVPDLGLAKPA